MVSEYIVFYIDSHLQLSVVLQDELKHAVLFKVSNHRWVMARLNNIIVQCQIFQNVEFASIVQKAIVLFSFEDFRQKFP